MSDQERLVRENEALRKENESLRKSLEASRLVDISLQQTSKLLRSVFDDSIVQMSIMEACRDENGKIEDFKILLVNGEFERSTKRTDLVEKLYVKEYPGICETEIFDTMVHVMETALPASIECYYPYDGFDKWISCQFVKSGGCIVMTVLDITDRKNKEQELQEVSRFRQMDIMNAVFAAQEAERQRLGEALHNGVAQLLYGIQTRLELLECADEDNEKITELLNITADAIKDIRNISFELVPAVLKDFGLEAGLRALFQRIVHKDLALNLEVKDTKKRLPEYFELAIYRIVQELVNNVVKHSQATHLVVHVTAKKNQVIVCVKDNGVGFDGEDTNHLNGGIGLKNIRNRILMRDGTISIVKKVPGTEVLISLPRKKIS